MPLPSNRKDFISVYCSYNRKDTSFQERLLSQVSLLIKEKLISFCYNSIASTEQNLGDATDTCQIILLLMSPDFIASSYSTDIKKALKRHREGTARVIPILLRPCDWEKIEQLGQLAPLPANGKPITRWSNRDEAWVDVAQGIQNAAIGVWEALEAYAQAIGLGSREASVYANRGHIFYDIRKHNEALQDYKQASKLGSKDPSVYAHLTSMGESLSFAHKHTQALDAYEHALPGSHGASNYANRGHILYIKNEYNQAFEVYGQAISLGSQEPLVYTNMGHILYKNHRHSQAVEAYKQAINFGSRDSSVYGNMGHAFYAFHQLDLAVHAYEQASALDSQDPFVYANMGRILYDAQKYEQAQQAYEQAINFDSQDSSVYANMGHILYARHQLDLALNAYEQASTLGSQDPSVYHNKGKLLANQGKYEEALKDLNFAILLGSKSSLLYELKGDIHYALQQYRESFKSYKHAMLLSYNRGADLISYFTYQKTMLLSYWNVIYTDVKKLYLLRMREKKIVSILLSIRIMIVTCLCFLRLILFLYDSADTYNVKGRALLNLQQHKEALVAFEIAIQIDPESPDAGICYDNRGITLQMLGNYQEALVSHINATRLLPEDAQTWYHKGDDLEALGRLEEAEQAYEQAKKLEHNARHSIAG